MNIIFYMINNEIKLKITIIKIQQTIVIIVKNKIKTIILLNVLVIFNIVRIVYKFKKR